MDETEDQKHQELNIAKCKNVFQGTCCYLIRQEYYSCTDELQESSLQCREVGIFSTYLSVEQDDCCIQQTGYSCSDYADAKSIVCPDEKHESEETENDCQDLQTVCFFMKNERRGYEHIDRAKIVDEYCRRDRGVSVSYEKSCPCKADERAADDV